MTPPPPSPEKRALLEAFNAVVQATGSGPSGGERRRSLHPVTLLSLGVLAVVLGWLIAAQPEWVFVKPAPGQSPALREASLRLAMALEFERIERFQDSTGRFPTRLNETGQPVGNLTYTTTQFGGFVLEGADADLHLTLRSSDSLPAFVGNSYEVLSTRGEP